MNRKLLWAVLVIGLALVIAPFALGLPGKAAAGQRMLNGFQPIMQPDQVKITADYYDHVFVPLGTVTPMMSAQNLARFQGYMKGFGGMQMDAAKLVPMLAQALHMTPAQVQTLMATQLPSMAAMLQNLPAMQRDFGGLLGTMQQNVGIFSQVPAGLAHYKPLVHDDAGQRHNYKQVNSLPDFRLFTWFFVVPARCSSCSPATACSATRSPRRAHRSTIAQGRRRHERIVGSAHGQRERARIAHPLPDDLVELIAAPLPRARRSDADQAARPLARGRGDRGRADRARRHDTTERVEAPQSAPAGRDRRPPQAGELRALPDR